MSNHASFFRNLSSSLQGFFQGNSSNTTEKSADKTPPTNKADRKSEKPPELREKRKLNSSRNTNDKGKFRLDVTQHRRRKFKERDHLTASISFSNAEICAFRDILRKETIVSFLNKDKCFMLADRYLIAAVLLYCKRANLQLNEYSEAVFYIMLYMAHEFFEDVFENRWDILPWALGKDWLNNRKLFYIQKVEFLKRLNWGLNVSLRQADQVLAILDCDEITGRRRDGSHGGIWQEERQRVTEVQDPNPPCSKCQDMKDRDIFLEMD